VKSAIHTASQTAEVVASLQRQTAWFYFPCFNKGWSCVCAQSS